MKTPHKNIYDVLKLNRFVTISVTVMAFLSVTFSGILIYSTYKKALNSAFAVNTDGSIIPLKLVEQKENLEIEAKAHLALFHQNFYGLTPNNFEQNLEKALWLGNASVDEVYRQKKSEGVYNRLLQYSLVQKVISIESKLVLDREPYAFQTVVQFEINRGSTVDNYELVTTGNLLLVERHFPNNTHGLLISDYFEKSLRKLSPKE
ncbi:MAG: conjugal transfer protein TraK [Bacteroidota bacterium]